MASGRGISLAGFDGEEARLGFNPSSPGSTPPTSTNVVAIEVAPSALSLVVNTLTGPRLGRLIVTARLSNGSTVDVTEDPGTTYESMAPSVAVVDSVGTAAGVAPGGTFIVVRRGSLTAQVPVTVRTFTAGALASVSVPGYANNVEVVGGYAYVAAGATGLQVVDVRDRRAPRVVGALDTNGNADDVRIAGNLAYVADGPGGLKIMSIANRTAPVLVGSVAVPGDAMDVFVQGGRAYLACGSEGLRVVDVSNPAAPALLGGVVTQNRMARGVSVSGTTAVVVDDNVVTPRFNVIDVADALNPRVLGVRNLSALAGGGVKDVETRGTLAYAVSLSGLAVVSFADRAAPLVVGSYVVSSTDGFSLRDLVLHGDYAVCADERFINVLPFINVSNPASPRFTGLLDFGAHGDYAGTGIAADGQYVYMTGERDVVRAENGVTGVTRLFIGQYDSLTDEAGLAPTVLLDSPSEGQSAAEGTSLALSASATDDVGVAGEVGAGGQCRGEGAGTGRP